MIACAALACAQGFDTTATKNDWEEINFEFGSSVLSDGYPSLLRLAELLHQNPDYRVNLDGNADSIGGDRVNNKLSVARAEAVKAFLVKYGSSVSQITVAGHGKKQPKVSNKTREGRFMNRRVTLTVADGQGKVVSAGGIGDAIKAMQSTAAAEQQRKKCCEDVLKRLDKLDEILAAIKDLKTENDKLKQDVASLKQGQAGVEKQVAELPRAPEKTELQKMMDTTAAKAIDKAKPSRFSLLGIDVGPTLTDASAPGRPANAGSVSVSGRGQYFAPFGKNETAAVQAQAEYMYFRDRQEGQFDLGLVNRWSRVQAGAFSSFKHVNLTNIGGGTLGQVAFTTDVLFSRGRVGFFGTKGFLTDPVLGRTPTYSTGQNGTLLPNYDVLTEYYLRVVDQVGMSAQVGVWNNAYFEGNFGALFRSAGGNRPGGMIRLVQPITTHIAGTLEAGLNETMVGSRNTGRVAFGVQFGNWMKPKDFLTAKHPVPVDIPRVRYEVLTREVRTGHAMPVADAGPDQNNVAAGTVTLDASASYSPDSLTLSYLWQQIGGPTVQIANANAARATFTAAASQTYQFRVTVTDNLGGQATAKTTVTTAAGQAVTIINFSANPPTIQPGGATTLAWQVQDADTVEISTLGQVNPKAGTASVAPTQTTTYTLTARNSKGQVNQTITVTVAGPAVAITSFAANPANITLGQRATLNWATQNATSASISGLGAVQVNGSVTVQPTVTTTYTLTVTGADGKTATQTVTVTVGTANSGVSIIGGPRIFIDVPHVVLYTSGTGKAPLSYRWTGPSNIYIGQRGSSALILPQQYGDYPIMVTMTDGNGVTYTDQVTVTYLPRQE